MNVQWTHIILPLGVGLATGLFTDATMWSELNEALLSVVAIVSAGVLVRLARGVPFSVIDVLEADEARKLSDALKQAVRALGGLLAGCFLTALCLAFIGQLNSMFESETAQTILPFTDNLDYVAFLVSLLLSFVFVRTYAVVKGDIEIVDIQADILVRQRNKETAEEFKERIAKPAGQNFSAPKNYGGVKK